MIILTIELVQAVVSLSYKINDINGLLKELEFCLNDTAYLNTNVVIYAAKVDNVYNLIFDKLYMEYFIINMSQEEEIEFLKVLKKYNVK